MKSIEPEPWMADAACAEVDPELWFPEPGNGTSQIAKQICRTSCPVIEQCLAFALENQEYGIWGGTSAVDRRKLRREAAA